MIARQTFVALAALPAAACAFESSAPPQTTLSTDSIDAPVDTGLPMRGSIVTTTSDGVTIYGERFYGDLDSEAPLILLFHQGGSNGRGEYAPLTSWLNELGYRAIAWDQRSGGEMFGESNRTRAGMSPAVDPEFCGAYPDLKAALDFVIDEGVDSVIAWGSSYSAALVFRLAAQNPSRVSGVIAFSPAAGGPMEECRARRWIEDLDVPILALRPASEMTRQSSIEQRRILVDAGASFLVIENGVHGSSMLIDERTKHDMSNARAAVAEWLP